MASILPHRDPENIEQNDLDPDEGNRTLCKACTLPIFSTPLYKNDTNFPLHKDCAKLPMSLDGHFMHPREPLDLFKELSLLPDNRVGRLRPSCGLCKKKCTDFIYICPDRACRFALDVLCAVPIGTIKVLHQSHEHELVPITAEVSVTCRVCKLDNKGLFYFCKPCNFWIHWDCALLPNKIKRKDHHSGQHILLLTYSNSLALMMQWRELKCAICESRINGLGSYICIRCEYVAHINCAAPASDRQSYSPALKEDSGLIHLPMKDEQTSFFPYLLKNTASSKSIEKEDLMHAEKLFSFKEKHEHPLIYHDHTTKDEEDHKHRLCNGCISPISLPFYRCLECSDFFLHSCCANLPLEFRSQNGIVVEPHVLQLHSKSNGEFFSVFKCVICRCISNGFVYTHNKKSVNVAGMVINKNIDVECTFLPKYITHAAHPKSHFIFLAHCGMAGKEVLFDKCICCGGGKAKAAMWYECGVCHHFKIHIRCAKLPMTVAHKFDKHPLMLSKLLPTTELDDERFCEICEENIDTKLWYYGCNECHNWFHIDCIPSVGELSKIKFGGTTPIPRHDCPLTFIRLLTEYNHKCGICKKTIDGFKDNAAFECSKCDFRVHYSCLNKEGRSIRSSSGIYHVKHM